MRVPAPVLCVSACLLLLAIPAFAEDEEKPKSRMWQRLERMDANGDGKVSRDEFRGPDRFWNRLDGDKDGVVTRKEADAMGGRMGERGERGGRAPATRGVRGLALEKIDADKNGAISAREWAVFFEKADKNGDKILQKAEWDAAVGGGRVRDDAPKVGTPAPKVQVQMIDLPLKVDLSKPKRTTVLIFGSWT